MRCAPSARRATVPPSRTRRCSSRRRRPRRPMEGPWRQSEAPDLAGYMVYRRGAATGEFVRLTAKPIATTSYVDTTVASGQAYDYRVTAIDQAGNESAPSTEVHVAVP